MLRNCPRAARKYGAQGNNLAKWCKRIGTPVVQMRDGLVTMKQRHLPLARLDVCVLLTVLHDFCITRYWELVRAIRS